MRVKISANFFRFVAIEQFRIYFVFQHRLLHDLDPQGLPNPGRVQTGLAHLVIQFLDRRDVILFGYVEHAPVNFRFHPVSEIQVLSFLQQQLFINQRRD